MTEPNALDVRAINRDFRAQLSGVALVSEAAIDMALAQQALAAVASKAARYDPVDRAALLDTYRPVVIAGLSAIASTDYDEGTYWPHVAASTGTSMPQAMQQALSDAFRSGLARFGLSRFVTPQRNIGEILMHAGIPVPSIGAFLRVLQRRDSLALDLTGHDFCAWATGMSRATAGARGLDAPTWRFLTLGGDVATDFVDRSLEVLDAITDGREPLPLEALPAQAAAEIRRLLDDGDLQRGRARTRQRQARLVPRLALIDDTVRVVLPPFHEQLGADVTWRIGVAGRSWTRSIDAPWPGDPASEVSETVPAARSVTLALDAPAEEWTLPLVDPAAPLLAFDVHSRMAIPGASELPRGPVWLAFPNESDLDPASAIDHDGDLRVLEQIDAPYGWDGWSFVLADVSAARRLRPADADGRAGARWRYVTSIIRPALEDVPTLSHVRSRDGRKVLARRPHIRLPRDRTGEVSGEATRWQVTLSDNAGTVLSSTAHTASDDVALIDPWPTDAIRVVGEYSIVVRGPLGRGATFQIAVAEGVVVDASPTFRWIAQGGGLQPCSIRLAQPDGAFTIELEPSEQRAVHDLPGSHGALRLVTDVDAMWVSSTDQGTVTPPSSSALRVDLESLGTSELRLNTMPRARGWIAAIARGEEVQRITVDANATGIARVTLGALHDTARMHGSLRLHYGIDDREAHVATLAPRRLTSSMTVDGDLLLVDRSVEGLHLELGVQLDYAPWRTPVTLDLPADTDSVVLPPPLAFLGPLTVAARVEDPWSSSDWPSPLRLDDPNTSHLEADLDEHTTLERTLDDHFAHWVAGADSIPQGGDALEFAMRIYPALRSINSVTPRWQLRNDVADLTIAAGRGFIDAAGRAEWNRDAHTRLLVEGWAATAAPLDGAPSARLWSASPFLGLLGAGGTSASAERDDRIREALGASAHRILEDGVDPDAAVGAFRQESEILATLPPRQIDDIFRAAAPVPGAILDRDQRLLHARALFDARITAETRDAATKSSMIIRTARAILVSEIGEHAAEPLRARSGSDGWPSLPCVTLSLGLIARLASRGSERALRMHTQYRGRYGDLATAAPAFVEQDLVLAELWMTRWEQQ